MNKRQFILLGLLLMAVVVFTACVPKPAPTPAPAPVAVAPAPGAAVPLPQAPARQAWEAEWEKLVANARQEGRVVVYSTQVNPMARAYFREVARNKFGLRLESLDGWGAEISQKLISERRAGLYLADVYVGGSTTALSVLKPAGALQRLDDVILLPEVLDPKVWYFGGLSFADPEHKLLAPLAYPSPSIAINTNLVKPEEIKSYRNLLEPRWKGKIVMNDPTVAGTGGRWFAVVGVGVGGKPIMGLDFMRELVRQEPVILRDIRQVVEWLAHGKYAIALAPTSAPLAEFMRAGAPIQLITPEEGAYLTTGPGAVAFIDRAPHPNAARVFINWLLTKEGQTLFSKGNDVQSGRLDVPTEHLSPVKVRDPRAKYVWAEVEDFLLKESEWWKLGREIFAPLLK